MNLIIVTDRDARARAHVCVCVFVCVYMNSRLRYCLFRTPQQLEDSVPHKVTLFIILYHKSCCSNATVILCGPDWWLSIRYHKSSCSNGTVIISGSDWWLGIHVGLRGLDLVPIITRVAVSTSRRHFVWPDWWLGTLYHKSSCFTSRWHSAGLTDDLVPFMTRVAVPAWRCHSVGLTDDLDLLYTLRTSGA